MCSGPSKVWVVHDFGDHEYYGIEGVFATRELAQEHLEGKGLKADPEAAADDVDYFPKPGLQYEAYEIEEHDVRGMDHGQRPGR